MQAKGEKPSTSHRILTIVGIVLCVILVPILIINCTLLLKGVLNKDEVPTFGSIFPLIVLTDSMHDEFPSGSIIISRVVDPEEIKEGDIISFFDPESKTGAITTHAVIKLEYDEAGKLVSFRTKGSANNAEDRLSVPVESLVGRYTGFHMAGVGHVAMFMQTPAGFIVCVFVPLLMLVAYDVIRRRVYDKKHEDDKDELMRELEELRRRAAAAEAAAEVGVRSEEVGVEETTTESEPADAENAPTEETNSIDPK